MANNVDKFGDWEDLKKWEELAARPVWSFHHRLDPFQKRNLDNDFTSLKPLKPTVQKIH